MSEESILVFEERHMISIMLHISENEGCTKTELYDAVSNNQRMPCKLDHLEESGLIVQESIPDSRMVRLRLTGLGRQVCDAFVSIETIMSRRRE